MTAPGDAYLQGSAGAALELEPETPDREDALERELEGELEDGGDPSGVDPGWLLTEPDARKVRQAVLRMWTRQQTVASKRDAKERRNELLRAGVRGVRVVASEERDEFVIRAPLGAEDAPKAPNKADQLIRRIAATLTVDPPAAEVTPSSNADQERAAAELAERVLRIEGAPAERDDVSLLRQLIDLAGTYGSIFVHTVLHPQHALVPLEIQARREATTVDDAVMAPDPMTGVAVPVDPATLVTRYVRLDGTLTDAPAEARLVWQPKVVERICRPSQVRFVPPVGITGIEDALGVLVGEIVTLGEVVARCYGGERPAEEVVKQLVAWRPEELAWRRWVPRADREILDQETPRRPDGLIADDALVVLLTLYVRSSSLAPLGARLVLGGTPEPLVREPWRALVGEGETARQEMLPVPVAQMRWREDTATGDPFGVAGVDDLGPLEEMRAAMLKYILDYAYRFGSPQVYLPFGTTLQPGQLQRRDGSPIYIDPAAQPFYEQLPQLAPAVNDVYVGMGAEMDTASGLEEAAQGVSGPNVKSGRHAQQIIEQALVALAGLQQNANKCICRVWTIRLTWMRAYYAAPRLLKYLGEGGDYQQQVWRGVDLMGATDVQVSRGSGTMLPRSAKSQLAQEELQLALQLGDTLAVQRYYRHLTGGTTPLLGLQDDPVRTRIQRQLAQWRQQAPLPYPPPPPAPEAPAGPSMGMVMGPDGQPMPAPAPEAPEAPDPVAQQAAAIFAPNPTDELPSAAPVRLYSLTEALASSAFQGADPRYQQALVAEFQRMKAAAGVMTVQEQQQMQAQQAQQQQQAAAQAQQQQQQAEFQQRQALEQQRLQSQLQLKQAEVQLKSEADQALERQREAMQMATDITVRQNPNPELL